MISQTHSPLPPLSQAAVYVLLVLPSPSVRQQVLEQGETRLHERKDCVDAVKGVVKGMEVRCGIKRTATKSTLEDAEWQRLKGSTPLLILDAAALRNPEL